MKRFILALTAIFAVSVASFAQFLGAKSSPSSATLQSRIEMTGKNTGQLIITLTPSNGWHVYGFEVGEGGPKAMTADFSKSTGIKFNGDFKPSITPIKTHDDVFGIDVTYWDQKVELVRNFEVTNPASAKIIGTITYQGCNGETCNAPEKRNISINVAKSKVSADKK